MTLQQNGGAGGGGGASSESLRCLSLQLFVHGAEPLVGLFHVELREVANHLQAQSAYAQKGAPKRTPQKRFEEILSR